MDNMEKYDCFVSHSSKDASNAISLVERLESRGVKCWVAPRNIRAGANYSAEIVTGIQSSASLIVLISKDSLASRHVEREVNIADGLRKSIYPVKLIDIEIYGGLSFYLSVSQEIRLFEETSDPVEKLISSIKGGVASVDAHDQWDASVDLSNNTLPTQSDPASHPHYRESSERPLKEFEPDIDSVPSRYDRRSVGAEPTAANNKLLLTTTLCLAVLFGFLYFFAADKVEVESTDVAISKVPDTHVEIHSETENKLEIEPVKTEGENSGRRSENNKDRNTNVQKLAKDIGPSGKWIGEWSNKNGYVYRFTMSLEETDSLISGTIEWSLKKSPLSAEKNKLGLLAVEFVEGTFEHRTGMVLIRGVRKNDPHEIIALDEYRLLISNDARSINGNSHRSGGGLLVGDRAISEISNSDNVPGVKNNSNNRKESFGNVCHDQLVSYKRMSPQTFTNSPSDCDYYVSGRLFLRGDIKIEPGTTFIMAKDSAVIFDGGKLSAVGTADSPIAFRSEEKYRGAWKGVLLENMRSADLEHVKIDGGGQGLLSGLRVRSSSSISLKSTSVSNSYGSGVQFDHRSKLVAFSKNSFYANELYGLELSTYGQVMMLDSASDYSGDTEPNGNTTLKVQSIFVTDIMQDQVHVELKELNSPYEVHQFKISSKHSLTLQPGVEIVLPSRTNLEIEGSLTAEGTAEKPIKISRIQESSGAWGSLKLKGARITSTSNERERHISIKHLVLDGGGSVLNTAETVKHNTGAIVAPSNFALTLDYVLIKNSATWGLYCIKDRNSNLKNKSGASVKLHDVSFESNKLGSIGEHCKIME